MSHAPSCEIYTPYIGQLGTHSSRNKKVVGLSFIYFIGYDLKDY